MGRAKETIENVGKGGGKDEGEGSRLKDAIGYSDKKREIALQMSVDPYSTNTVLQKELDDVAWASLGGWLHVQCGYLSNQWTGRSSAHGDQSRQQSRATLA